jgi:hypothetical protein
MGKPPVKSLRALTKAKLLAEARFAKSNVGREVWLRERTAKLIDNIDPLELIASAGLGLTVYDLIKSSPSVMISIKTMVKENPWIAMIPSGILQSILYYIFTSTTTPITEEQKQEIIKIRDTADYLLLLKCFGIAYLVIHTNMAGNDPKMALGVILSFFGLEVADQKLRLIWNDPLKGLELTPPLPPVITYPVITYYRGIEITQDALESFSFQWPSMAEPGTMRTIHGTNYAKVLAYIDENWEDIEPPVIEPKFIKGVNYTWRWWTYAPDAVSDAELNAHFTTFKNIGLEWISIHVSWTRLEPTIGAYNTAFLVDLQRVAQTAKAHGLKVMLDNHTMTYALPNWGKTLDSIVTNVNGANAYYNMCMKLLETVTCDVFAMANEPTNGGLTVAGRDQAINTWARIANSSPIPVTIRCDWPSFNLCKDNPNFLTLQDFISVNYYPKWVSVGQLNEIKNWAGSKQFWITETGYQSSDEVAQELGYEGIIPTLKAVKPYVVMPWIWEHPTSGQATQTWNVCLDVNGTPRKALLL